MFFLMPNIIYAQLNFTSMFCYFILKTKIYAHHYLCFAVIALDIRLYLGFQSNLSASVIETYYSWGYDVLLNFIVIISTSFRGVLEKNIMNTYFLPPYRILLLEGTFVLIIFFSFFFIIQSVSCEGLGLFEPMCYKSKWDFVKRDIIDNFNYSSINTLFVWTYIIGVY